MGGGWRSTEYRVQNAEGAKVTQTSQKEYQKNALVFSATSASLLSSFCVRLPDPRPTPGERGFRTQRARRLRRGRRRNTKNSFGFFCDLCVAFVFLLRSAARSRSRSRPRSQVQPASTVNSCAVHIFA